MSLTDKRVLVIGGASGIGRAVAEGAIGAGASVVIASRDLEKIEHATGEIGASPAVLDVTNESAVKRFFESAEGFDHIVFTAGDWTGPQPGPIADLDLEQAPLGLNVRFWGAISVAKHGASRLPSGGSFTLTSGMIAHTPMKGSALQTAALGAIESLARGLAVDLAPVRVNCVCPGIIHTGVWDRIPEDHLTHLTARQLVPRPGQPDEAARAYLYLMDNDYATGQTLCIEGGSALGR